MEILTVDPGTLAQQALNAKLYVPTWILRSKLERIAVKGNGRIALAVESGQAIAVAVHDVFGQFMVFVNPEHRRKKIGTQLIDTLAQTYALSKENTFAGYGSTGSASFWKKVNVKMSLD